MLLTYTRAAFTVQLPQAGETIFAAGTVLEITLTGLSEHALAYNACTHCLVATAHCINEQQGGGYHHGYRNPPQHCVSTWKPIHSWAIYFTQHQCPQNWLHNVKWEMTIIINVGQNRMVKIKVLLGICWAKDRHEKHLARLTYVNSVFGTRISEI